MRNPFVIIGIVVIGTGIFCIGMALGLLGNDYPEQRLICGLAGIVAIVMGVFLIQLMKDDSLYQQAPIDKITATSTEKDQ